MIEEVARAFNRAKKLYDAKREDDRGQALEAALAVGKLCLETLAREAVLDNYGNFRGANGPVPYHAATYLDSVSRPYLDGLFTADPATFEAEGQEFAADMVARRSNPQLHARVIYTVMTAFSLCFDLWKPGSRKTPGTFFEVLIGSAAIHRFPGVTLSKHVKIEDVPGDDVDALVDVDGAEGDAVEALKGDSVATDLVLTREAGDRAAVIPLKITTRERIVQPFAHQRILSSAFGDKYASFIACISEVQRDGVTTSVKQVCVPGTVALFQKHMAAVNGLYYADVPERYARADLQAVLPVKSIGHLFDDVARHLEG